MAHPHEIPTKSALFGLEVRVGSLSQFPVSRPTVQVLPCGFVTHLLTCRLPVVQYSDETRMSRMNGRANDREFCAQPTKGEVNSTTRSLSRNAFLRLLGTSSVRFQLKHKATIAAIRVGSDNKHRLWFGRLASGPSCHLGLRASIATSASSANRPTPSPYRATQTNLRNANK